MKLKSILIAALLAPIAGIALGAVPSLVNYQGRLLDTSGNPRNGSYSMTFSVWDAASGGTQIWSETQASVTVSNGVFSVQLGSVTPLTDTEFDAAGRYLQVQIGGETATTRQRLASSPFAFRAAVADDVAPGDGDYIQNTDTLQSGSTFYVSSGTVTGPLRVGGILTAGSGANALTTAAGLIDAGKLTNSIPTSSLNGTWANVTAGGLLPGDTDYIQNRVTLQGGASFYVQSGSIAGPLTATGTVTLGGTAGVNDVTVTSDLIVSGDIRVNGNDLRDSAGTARITLGNPIVFNAPIDVAAPASTLTVNVPMHLNGTANADNYIAYPFTAGGTIAAKAVVSITGANTVTATAANDAVTVIGIAVTAATLGQTVWVATSGIVTGVVADEAIAVAGRVCSDATAGRAGTCTIDGAVIGKALTGAAGAGSTFTVVLITGN